MLFVGQSVDFEATGFVQQLSDVTAQSGETVILTCQVCGRPRPTLSWRGPDQAVLTAGGRISLAYTDHGLAMLQLHLVTPDMAGQYSCTAGGGDQGMATSSCTLTIAGTVAHVCLPLSSQSYI